MSLATLKKKTAHKYKNSSVNQGQFSINGTHRNQGFIGQTSLSRTVLRTPASGPALQGHGTCCGTYPTNELKTSSICSTENNEVVKPSVLSSKGMLQKRTQWTRRPAQNANELLVKPGDGSHLSSGSDYIVFRRKKELKKADECDPPIPTVYGDCCAPLVKPLEKLNVAKTQGDYIFELIDSCADLDISYVQYNQNTSKRPIQTCG